MGKAADTRLIILQKAFELIYRNGYQATSIDVIIATTQVTKGAFYYHFKSKEEMGLAIIKEVMYPGMAAAMIEPLMDGTDVPGKIYRMMEGLLLDNPFFDVRYGCPAINLIEEMSPLSQSFKSALTQLVVRWQHAIEHVLTLAQQSGTIRPDLSPRQIALFVITGYGGVRNMGKVFGQNCYKDFLAELKRYLQKLA
ncbi:TetR/AcrR family transcriptional regulator [Dyadobacter sediminis]|uniref:TetR/AcrR family transcriptional regulator n=1 Tax=Dyadobacter sediminis TaxID=1493691 RepID=A0A5R9KJK2_9BACT|nr:TetR/AcrR family transcriptional regulator [Dyadobacter sediminis]TLU96397.1 TetR/AcrR family transcriptional regulator [Dyadobacter sediminis]GGB81928.1 TetR family transcriptional regulator [Dyadobacter sediminis]